MIEFDEMVKTPGIYLVILFWGVSLVEVADDLVCPQLKYTTYERDGVLERDGWIPGAINSILGPFTRAPRPHKNALVN